MATQSRTLRNSVISLAVFFGIVAALDHDLRIGLVIRERDFAGFFRRDRGAVRVE